MIEEKIDDILGEAWVNRSSKTHSRTKDIDFIKPPDTGFRRGRSLEHEFGSYRVDADADTAAHDVNFVVQQNLRCCWTCAYVGGSSIISLECRNNENKGKAFDIVEPIGVCSRYRNKGVYK